MESIVRTELNDLIREKDFSGVVMIRSKGQIVFESASGLADRANERPIKLDTKFGIASGTKTFTATGMMKLIESGKLKLDSKALDYIDYDYPTYDKGVTIDQLLCHRSGLPDYFDEEEVEDFDNFTVGKSWSLMFEPKDYYEIFPQKPMKAEPGSVFNYNNSGYVMLAGIIAKVSGVKYAEYLEEEIFKAAGMTGSGFYPMNQLPANTAYGYIDYEGGYRTNIFNLPIVGGGDGGAFTTGQDLFAFWDAFMDGQLISKAGAKSMTQPISPLGEPEKGEAYGKGFWLKPNLVMMEGCDAGVSFQSGNYLDRDLQYVVLSNTTNGAWDIVGKIQELTPGSW